MIQLLYRIDLILLSVGGLIAAGALAYWVIRGTNPLLGSPLRPSHFGPVAVWLCITAHFLGGSLGSSIGGKLAPSGINKETRDVWQGIIGTDLGAMFSITVCLLVTHRAFRDGWKGLGFGKRSLLRDFVTAIPICMASLTLCNGVAWVTERLMRILIQDFKPPQHSVFEALHDPVMPTYVQRFAIFGALILAPVAEELLFRGVLQTAIQRLFLLNKSDALLPAVPEIISAESPAAEPSAPISTDALPALSYAAPSTGESQPLRYRWAAIIVVAAFFGAMHLPTPQHVPALLVFGVILGYLYERTGSITLPILVHFMFNGKSLLWDALMR